jgi:hypothetical protein
VHISVVILVAEGSARSKSEGEIIDHHRQKELCLSISFFARGGIREREREIAGFFGVL